jgi:hypothetical protein
MTSKKKNPSAVVLGRLGGRARAANLSAKELSESARKAGLARQTKLSDAKRKRIAQVAAKARWRKKEANDE